jgi:predicted secreted protein
MNKEMTIRMKELIKKAREQGKVLPVSEAFKMYPVEDEAHKGELNYWLQGEKRLTIS